MFCKNCGNKLNDGSKFCPACGTAVAAPFTPPDAIPAEDNASVPFPHVTPEAPAAPFPPVTPEPPAVPFSPVAPAAPFPPAEDDGAGETTLLTPPEQPGYDEIPFTYAPAQKPKSKPGKGLIIAIIAVAIVVVGAVAGFFIWNGARADKYAAAMEALDSGEFDAAREMFLSLGSYEDSEEMAAELQELEDAYIQAKADLDALNFQKAVDAFWDIYDYKDSADYADYEVPFAAASYVKECADSGELPNDEMIAAMALDENADYFQNQLLMYEFAGDEFSYLDSQEALTLSEECYYNCAVMNLEYGDFGMAGYFADYLTTRYEDYLEIYAQYCADGDVLADLLECVNYFYYSEYTATEYVEFLYAMIEKLNSYEYEEFSNWELQTLALDYANALEAELGSWNSTTVVTDYNYYMACASQSRIIEQLITDLNFLADDPDLQNVYIGEYAYYEACAEVADDMYYNVNGQSIEQDNGGYFVTYTNGTAYTVTMQYNFTFQDMNEDVLAESKDSVIEVAPGETVKLYMNVPNEIVEDWYYWVFNRIFEISAG